MAKTIFFVGGIRSGKSAAALSWAWAQAKERHYIATARVRDQEMAERVHAHKKARGDGWCVHEEPIAVDTCIASILASHATDTVIILDCLSAWVANLMEEGYDDAAIQKRVHDLVHLLATTHLPIGLVSLEVGLGIVPMSALARRYGDVLGACNQCIAQACQTVLFFAVGLPLVLKGTLPESL
ncbi:MAG: bifunctional adenosylcobinamide kinase/adenosylcobinamide-phosphate guanylyltransferase [Desulfovibrio sp.]|nr:bifunctional adenosylcobinamide kinase/adenosylcobinamide-phosphate guanylyltransferase [Desulfovibrio sp.]